MGIVVILDIGCFGLVMVFCVDMDVLDFSEEQDVSYCFYCDGFVLCNVGMMYVCGYDGYIVIGFGLVYIFK